MRRVLEASKGLPSLSPLPSSCGELSISGNTVNTGKRGTWERENHKCRLRRNRNHHLLHPRLQQEQQHSRYPRECRNESNLGSDDQFEPLQILQEDFILKCTGLQAFQSLREIKEPATDNGRRELRYLPSLPIWSCFPSINQSDSRGVFISLKGPGSHCDSAHVLFRRKVRLSFLL